MHTTIRGLAAGSLMAAAAFAAPATAAVTITGSVSNVTFGASDPGLVVSASPVAFPTFTLNDVGDFTVLTVGTGESSVDLDDFVPLPITVAFQFVSPAGATGVPVAGNTVGFIAPFTNCGFRQGGCGAAIWNAPTTFAFGEGGLFSVSLSDAIFATPGSASVTGRFTLVSAPVPEPSTWAMLVLGFAAVGGAMRSRRRQSVRLTYA